MSLSKPQLPRFPKSGLPTAAAGGGSSAGAVGADWTDWGEKTFGIPGTYTWEPNVNIENICVVCVGGGASSFKNGGGALAWKNGISCQAGDVFTVIVGDGGSVGAYNGGDTRILKNGIEIIFAGGGKSTGEGGVFSGAGVSGGNGGEGTVPGGAGAGGYLGDGGRTGGLPSPNSGAAAGDSDSAGGGVGLFGIGQTAYVLGQGGSGGSNGGTSSLSNYTGSGGLYGGGAGSINAIDVDKNARGGHGGVRIIWGEGRAFPSINCG